MLKRMFSKTLKTRIFISCGVLLFLCILSNAIGFIGQSTLLNNFQTYEKIEQTFAEALEIDRDVQELKSRSESYIQTGNQSQYQTAKTLQANLLDKIDELQVETESSELATVSQEMRLHIEAFGKQLRLAADERDIRSSLVQEELPGREAEIQTKFADLSTLLKDGEHLSALSLLLEAEQAFTAAGRHLLQYFISPHAEEIDLTVRLMEQARHSLGQLTVKNEQESKHVRELCNNLNTNLEHFQKLALRAVYATRGYLYYSNVVMAGEISEFVYYSNRLKRVVTEQQILSREDRSNAAGKTRTYSLTGSLLAIIVASLLATHLSYSLVNPISQLTQTFKRLSDGETVEKIDATGRSDEIGRMAQAAQVFSDKNHETKVLLERSNALSDELASKARALEESNEELDNFAYVASHDLKSPLRGINSLAAWVKEDCVDLIPDSSREHLDKMQSRVKKMESLLDNLLNYSRVGRVGENLELVDTAKMIDAIIELNEDCPARIETDCRLPIFTTARAPFQQVLLNLITNATKYNDKGEHGWVHLSCADFGSMYRFSISDNGIGIASNQLDRVFKMYQRLSSMNVDGSGMGLAIVKKQIENYGGEISVESEPGKGSTFTFTWPKEIELRTGDSDEFAQMLEESIRI